MLGLAQALLLRPVRSSSSTGTSNSTGPVPATCPGPGVPLSLLAAPRKAPLTLTSPIRQPFSAALARSARPGAPLSTSVLFGGALGQRAPTAAAPPLLRQPPECLRLALKVSEREVRESHRVLVVHVGDEGYGGRAPRAPPRARQRRLVYEVDHFVSAEAPQLVLVVLPAADDARQVLEGVHAVLRAPALAVRVMVVVALLVVGDQAAPAPLVARQGGAVVGTHYHVLGRTPSVQI